jgi:3-oxoacyl-[acyl-carrier-protein] synthase-3
MSTNTYTRIIGTGSYIPTRRIKNEDFLGNSFFETSGTKSPKGNQEIIDKFLEITTIEERRYVTDDLVTSDIAYYAAEEALKSADINRESLDQIIVAHNFGDVQKDRNRSDLVPTLAARVKKSLGIENPNTTAYDLPFGCPGWLEGVIHGDRFIRSGDDQRILVVGAEILSRVSDPHDRDSMLYGDGAGAVILAPVEQETPTGILAHSSRSDTITHSRMLSMGPSYDPEHEEADDIYLKMNGRKLYQYALETVPSAIKACLEKSCSSLKEVAKLLLHQANGKMDNAILERLFGLYGDERPPEGIMPMIVPWTGNSSVATLPTLLDLILKGRMEGHRIEAGDKLIFASVGAGMNINAMIYHA